MPLASNVVDLTIRRARAEQAVAAVAAAPVRFVPVELLEALDGSWGDPEEPLVGQHLTLAH